MERDPSRLQWLRDREPAFDALGVKPKLFTDMYLFGLFLHNQLAAHSKMNGDLLSGAEGSNAAAKATKTSSATVLPFRSFQRKKNDERLLAKKIDPASKTQRSRHCCCRHAPNPPSLRPLLEHAL